VIAAVHFAVHTARTQDEQRLRTELRQPPSDLGPKARHAALFVAGAESVAAAEQENTRDLSFPI
jgi:hypothetical protein